MVPPLLFCTGNNHAQNRFVPYRFDTVSFVTYGRNAKAYCRCEQAGFGLELGSPFIIPSTLIRTNHQLSVVSKNDYSSSSLPLKRYPLSNHFTQYQSKKQEGIDKISQKM